MAEEAELLAGETCAFCKNKTLTLTELVREVPYFGKVCIFSMDCSSCNYHKADVESEENHPPVKYALEVESQDDLKIRIVKASTCTIKIPHVGNIEPGEAANGYVTNVEGVLNRIKHQIEVLKEQEEDPAAQKKAKNLLKKLRKVLWGEEKLKMILEDPQGNSAIVSEKAVKTKL